MKLIISIIAFIFFSFGGNVFGGNLTSARTIDLNFIDRLTPEGFELYTGKVLAIKRPWFSNDGQMKIQIEVEKFPVGGGKSPPKKMTLKGRFPELTKNQRYIIVNSPPGEVAAIIPYDTDEDLNRVMTKVHYETKRDI